MSRDLLPDVGYTRKQVSVDVSEQEHGLEKENACGPDACRSAEIRQKHFANHRLAQEKKKRADEKRSGEYVHWWDRLPENYGVSDPLPIASLHGCPPS